MDKTNGYDFIYRQNVIKPALVGLAGPWISRRHRIQLAAASSAQHVHAVAMSRSRSTRMAANGLVQRSRSDEPHERDARRLPASGQVVSRTRRCDSTTARRSRRRSSGGRMSRRASTRSISVSSRPMSCIVADHAKRAMSAFPLCDRPLLRRELRRARRERRAAEIRCRAVVPRRHVLARTT